MQPWRPAVRLAIGIAEPCQAGSPNLQAVVDDVVEHAATNGIRLLDTADAYAPAGGPFGLGETVARRAVERLPPSIRPTIMTKGGHTRPAGGWATNGGHAYLRAAARASRDRLGQGCLDLYTFHRPDPAVEFTESLDALRSLVADGVARTITLSNVSPEQIHQGREALGEALVAVQPDAVPATGMGAGVAVVGQ